jgi:pyruvate dehydrogenase E2 component (dihydrolipoyllysine-residue acetyltransferase)
MSIAVVMPQLGLTMEEGTVSAWLKKSGDRVKKDEPLFSVSTDKVEMDVESVADGVLGEIIEPAGKTVPVGAILAYIEGSAEDAQASREGVAPVAVTENAAHPESADATQAGAKPGNDGKTAVKAASTRQGASPRAKRLANELGIDLTTVRARNSDGQITEADVRLAQKTPQSNGSRQQLVAERLIRSAQTIPTFSVAAEVNAENLAVLHESLKTSLGEAGIKLTITDLLLSVFAQALKNAPELNATWEEKGIRHRTSVEIGLAIATDRGLVAPVIRNVETLDLQTLAAQRSHLVEKARSGRLSLADLEGGVGTLSNLGMYRVDHFQAIVPLGQTCILAVGHIRERPWVEKTLTIKRTLWLNLTVDHRVADGAAAAVFLSRMIELIEDPRHLPRGIRSFSGGGAERRLNG